MVTDAGEWKRWTIGLCLTGFFTAGGAFVADNKIDLREIKSSVAEVAKNTAEVNINVTRALAQNAAQDKDIERLAVQEASSRSTITELWGKVIRLEARGR